MKDELTPEMVTPGGPVLIHPSSFILSEDPRFDLPADPRDHLVEHLIQSRRCLEAEQALRLLHRRHSTANIVGERFVRGVAERLAVAVDLAPYEFGQFKDRRRLAGGEVEILVQGRGLLDAQADAARQIAAVGVMAYLAAVAQDVQRVLTL